MNILADRNMAKLAEILQAQPGAAQVEWFSGRQPDAEQLAQAEVMLIRSVTKIDQPLLQQAPNLRWLGTATIGTEHVDSAALHARGIPFYSTAGVNAAAVGDYVASAVAALTLKLQRQPNASGQLDACIVGAGNTGRAAGARLQALGYHVHYYDPPLVAAGEAGVHAQWQRVLAADLVSCHVPLTDVGEWPTRHLFDAQALAQLPAHGVLINASRGAVVAEQALLRRLQDGPVLHAVLDVWEHEPQINPELLALLALGTAHIAGHSVAGKVGGTLRLLEQLNHDFNLALQLPTLSELLASQPQLQQGKISIKNGDLEPLKLASLVLSLYDIRHDDQLLRAAPATPNGFDQLRKNYAPRAELSTLELDFSACHERSKWQHICQLFKVKGRS